MPTYSTGAAKAVNQSFKAVSENELKGIIEYSEAPLVSADIVGNPHSAIFDSMLTRAIPIPKHEMVEKNMKYIKWFEELGIGDVALVGGKNASLGEMIRNLAEKGVNVPSGFAITADAYKYLIEETGIKDKIRDTLADLDTSDMVYLAERGSKIRGMIRNAQIPADLEEEVRAAYREMEKRYGEGVDVAVRSSATAEDLPTASFAGQQDTYLNVRGEEELVEKVMECFASLFTNRAISYRVDKGFDHLGVYLSAGVQNMVRSDLACSGVMFSLDTDSGFRDVVYITGAYGLGEYVVQGTVNPDQFFVFKPTLKEGFKPIVEKKLEAKRKKLVYNEEGTGTEEREVAEKDRERFVLTDPEVLTLANWACTIEEHYDKPMDIEWAKDGRTGELFIVQARPETVHSQKDFSFYETYVLEEEGEMLVQGEAVGAKIGYGEVNVIADASEIEKFKPGQVLVTEMTDPDWEPIMKIAGAIVTTRGGRTCHAAIISRELGIPCVIGTDKGTSILKDVQDVTVDCSQGMGRIFDGKLKYHVDKVPLHKLPRPHTKIMMNMGVPGNAFIQGQIPNDGVGLAREEFIINSYIGIHPLALIEYKDLKKRAMSKDYENRKGRRRKEESAASEEEKKIAEVIKEIDDKSAVYADKTDFFVDQLASGVGKIAAGFYPNDVIVRFSDFKSNEYTNLTGGFLYEPVEDNPMIGWRGASRYYNEKFKPAFGLECNAIRKVRDEMGLTNVKVMVPFCRTPEEGRKVIETMAEFGLKQGENGLEVYVMCEIPSNVILADQYADVFDGFSIGSNDLTQLTLGLDRDSDIVADLFDERNEAVKWLVKHVIEVAHAHEPRRKIGICGQAPSDYPDFAEFLVECGIDSLSLNPDIVVSTRLDIAKVEEGKK